MTRVAVLIADNDTKLGRTVVNDAAHLIRFDGFMFVRTGEAIRLSKTGTGTAAVFRQTEVYDRNKLELV